MKLYTIHRDAKANKHWRESHEISDKRISQLPTAVSRINNGTVAFAMDDLGRCWAACRVEGETLEGSCASSAAIERDHEMHQFLINHSSWNTIDKIIAIWGEKQ